MKLKLMLGSAAVAVALSAVFRHLVIGGGKSRRLIFHNYDALLAFSLLAVVFACAYALVAKIASYHDKRKGANFIFITLSLALLVFPMTRISDEEISKKENRKLNSFPRLVGAQGFNYNYGREFEAWLNDHFRAREKVMAFQHRADTLFARRAENDRAMEGRDGWLFYKGDNSVRNFQNLNGFSEEQLQNLRRQLEAKRDFCERLGCKYYLLIAPDKNQVYGEFYPDEYRRVGSQNRGTQLVEYLRAQSTLKIAYPLDALLAAKAEHDVYYKTDTHWNTLGAYYGYAALGEQIRQDFPALRWQDINDFTIENVKHKSKGDLLNMLRLPGREYPTGAATRKAKNNYKSRELKEMRGITADKGRPVIISDGSSPHKVIVLRDSFCTALVPYLSQQFGHVEYFWTRHFFKNKEYIRREKPDIVIEECVERYCHVLVR